MNAVIAYPLDVDGLMVGHPRVNMLGELDPNGGPRTDTLMCSQRPDWRGHIQNNTDGRSFLVMVADDYVGDILYFGGGAWVARMKDGTDVGSFSGHFGAERAFVALCKAVSH